MTRTDVAGDGIREVRREPEVQRTDPRKLEPRKIDHPLDLAFASRRAGCQDKIRLVGIGRSEFKPGVFLKPRGHLDAVRERKLAHDAARRQNGIGLLVDLYHRMPNVLGKRFL